jgi:hypothetical protein
MERGLFMNINGMARSFMARYKYVEDFLLYVANIIEEQLQEWDKNYEVIVMKLQNYEIVVKNHHHDYQIQLSTKEIETLKKQGPYQLDRKIWSGFVNQELPIKKGYGNYIKMFL